MKTQEENDKFLEEAKELFQAIKDGYGGILKDGSLVDRRHYPKANKIKENKDLNIGKPKDVKP